MVVMRVSLLLVGSAVGWLLVSGGAIYLYKQLQQSRREVARVTALRQSERQGRKRVQERLEKQAMRSHEIVGGYIHRQIGVLRTPFPTLQGTPRQGTLVPHTKGVVVLDDVIARDALEGLAGYTHVWIVYVFHKNSNFHKHERAQWQACARPTEGDTGNPDSSQPQGKSKHARFRFTAKVSPPALKGKKTGVFSTRSPHHPNAIGIIAVKLEGVNQQKREVYVSGLDCVDGTPVLDIKPYLPCATVPMWVESNPPAAVTFASDAIQQFKTAFETGVMKFYTDFDSALIAAGEVVSVNIKAKEFGVPRQVLFDGLRLTYVTRSEDKSMLITGVEVNNAPPDVVSDEDGGDEGVGKTDAVGADELPE